MIHSYLNFIFFFLSSWIKKNANVHLLVLKFSSKTRFLLFRRLCQRLFLNFQKKRLKSLLSLFFLSWKWKFLTKNKTFQYFDSFVKISLICVKIRRFALFNSSMISAILFVKKYNFVNTVTIIANRFNVSMFVFFRLFIKSKKKILLSLSWNSSSQNHLMSFFFRFFLMSFFFSTLFDVVFFSTFFDVVFFSTFLSALSASFDRFFVSFSSDYRDSLFVRRSRFLSRIFQKKSHVWFHFSINLREKNVKYFSNFWKT